MTSPFVAVLSPQKAVPELALLSAAELLSDVLDQMRTMVGQTVGASLLYEAKAILSTTVDQQADLRRMSKDGISSLLGEVSFEIDPSSPKRMSMRAPDGWLDRLDSLLGNYYCRRCASLVTRYAPHSGHACAEALVSGVLDA